MRQSWAVILAAGEGTRMKSSLPKVMHLLCGKPLLWHVLRSAQKATARQVVVVGHGADRVRDYFGEKYIYVEQSPQLGTGHALLQALPHLPESGEVLVLCGDTPLLEGGVLEQVIEHHRDRKSTATVITAQMDNPTGYGRIIRDSGGKVIRIVEELEATPEQKAIREVNTGSYCFDLEALKRFLPLLPKNERKGEYYLTDLLFILVERGYPVEAFLLKDSRQALGINDRSQLALAASWMRKKINQELMRAGVTMLDPGSVYVDLGVEVGKDTVIYPQVILEGATWVGENCLLGPGVHLVNARVGHDVICRQAVVLDSEIRNGAQIGPYAYIRPGSIIEEGAKIGDFVEIKNSTIGAGSKVPHLSYVGDASLGPDVNMGAGSIVVNYDGRRKHRTNIEEGAFIGCNSNLVAPLTIGKGAFIAAGSTITRDVPPGSLALSRSRQEIKEGLARRFLGKKDEK